jgi:hypothetical protein
VVGRVETNSGHVSVEPASPAIRVLANRFLLWCGLFFAFLALVCLGAVEWVGFRTGEAFTPSQVAVLQQEDKDILWLGPLKDWAAYKIARAKEQQPEIVIIGHSRCNQFRSAMFLPYKMYNSCLTAWLPSQIYTVIDSITKTSHPKIVIFALDYFMFSDDYARGYTVNAAMDYSSGIVRHIHQMGTFLRGLSNPERMMAVLSAPEPDTYHDPDTAAGVDSQLLGYEALRAKAGFRYDGSFLYPYGERQQAPEINKDPAKYVTQSFPGGATMNQEQLAWLQKIASLGKQRGITLVALQLPFLAPAIHFIDTDPAYHPYAAIWREFESEATRDALSKLGIFFYDTTRDPVSEDERYFVDPAHPNEAGDLTILLHLLDQHAEFRGLFPRIDVDRLRQELNAATQEGRYFSIYQNQF